MKLVLIRHGQSLWNLENRFTGWVDVDLSERGYEEAHLAGRLLKEQNIHFSSTHTSVLKRAIKTLHIVLEELDALWLPETKSWRLNERHYGGLQGLNKVDTAKKYGDEQVHVWRRSYDTLPPELGDDAPYSQSQDPRYHAIRSLIPHTENLKVTLRRVMPYWEDVLAPALYDGKNLLVAAHGNSLRALTKHLEHISDEEIMNLEIPTGTPIIYTLDENLSVVDKKILHL